MTIQGAVPLTVDRFFSSREKKEQDQKWELFSHHRATKSGNRLYIQEASGIAIPYTKVAKGLYVPDESFFTNEVPIHSLHNPKLNRAVYDGKRLTIYQSDGTKRTFRPYWSCERKYGGDSIEFVLVRETHRDGHVKHYKWKIEKSLFPDPAYSNRREHFLQFRKAFVTSPDGKTVYNSVEYDYSGDKVLVEGSNGKTLKYETTSRSKGTIGFIDHVTSSDHPRCTHKWDKKKLKKFIFPGDRKVVLSYDGDKISKLQLLENLTYTFEYYKGWTNVVHPDHSRSTYYHSKHRLDKIVHYGREMSPMRTELFEWTKEGKLARKEIQGHDQIPLLTLEYEYDENLNLICQKTTGAICTDAPITLMTEYEYDSLHRLTKETECTGYMTQYRYRPYTHLPEERLESKNGVILKKTTYVYDSNNLLISEIVDDEGFSPVQYSLDIVRFHDGPHVGMPIWIDHFTNGHLTSKDHYIYDPYNNVEVHEIHDADGELSHKTIHVYNDQGLLKKRVDPLGHIYKYRYNENREVIFEKRPSGLVIQKNYDNLGRLQIEKSTSENETQEIHYKYHNTFKPTCIIDHLGDKILNQYDGLGNLIKTTLPGGGTTTLAYNVLGHIISKTDPLGHTTYTETNIFGKPLGRVINSAK